MKQRLSDLSIEPQNVGTRTRSHSKVAIEKRINKLDISIGADSVQTPIASPTPPVPAAPQVPVQSTPAPTATPEIQTMPEQRTIIGPGTMIGSNKIIEMIGQGGMTCVYKVWNSELETYRCLKVVRSEGSQTSIERFATEAKISAQFDHPNIVHIFNIGHYYDLPYIEMEYIEGETLQHYITKYGRLPDTIAASVALGIAKALAFIHKHDFTLYGKHYHGIIHRDLKPANIMITTDGSVKLMDFGIARPVETGFHTSVDKNIVGTMQYFAPEQLNNEEVDQSSDIYALGAILYEMLTGCKTFPYTTLTMLVQKKSINSFKPLNQFDFPVHTQLRKISSLCLKTEKHKRYSNADALLSDIQEVLSSFSLDHPKQEIEEYVSAPYAPDDVTGTGIFGKTGIHQALKGKKKKKFFFFG